MPQPKDLYLDIETTRSGGVSMVGMWSEERGLVQLYGHDLTTEALENAVPTDYRVVTFNGLRFDLPIIARLYDLDLRLRNRCLDLMDACHAKGIKGGQKAIEERLGIRRETEGMRGYHAPQLWDDWWEAGNRDSLDVLLKYNEEDVMGMVTIHRFLDDYFLFPMV